MKVGSLVKVQADESTHFPGGIGIIVREVYEDIDTDEYWWIVFLSTGDHSGEYRHHTESQLEVIGEAR